MEITGKTRIFGILAHPSAHVRTPQTLNPLFAERGVDAAMIALDVPPERLAATVAGLRDVRNFGGFVVTVPHKTAIVALCGHVSARARLAGAVNVVRRESDGALTGDLLDGEGFAAGLAMDGIDIAGRRVFLAGAGGAASAIGLAMAERGAAALTIVNRSRDKAEALAERLRGAFPSLPLATEGGPGGHDLAINATSLGLKPGDPLPFSPDALDQGAIVAEAVMDPDVTPLLAAARARGLRVHRGFRMLEGQAREMLRFLLPDVPGD